MDIKKPPIYQAGSAEAFVDSTATGRKHSNYAISIGFVKKKLEGKT